MTQSSGGEVGSAQGVRGGPRAGFWTRFGASLLDGLLCSAVALVLELALHSFGYFLGLFGTIAYFVWFEGGPKGAGYGKQWLGIRVIDIDTGRPIGYSRAAVRYLGKIVSTLCLLLGYLWMLWDPESQCWHDKFARAVVVPVTAYAPRDRDRVL